MLTLTTIDIANLVRCTDLQHQARSPEDTVTQERDAFFDGIDRYMFDSTLGFATATGEPTHERWLATVSCLAPPRDHHIASIRLRNARAALTQLHETLFGSSDTCRRCQEAFDAAHGLDRDQLLLVRETTLPWAATVHKEDQDDALSRIRLLTRAERLKNC